MGSTHMFSIQKIEKENNSLRNTRNWIGFSQNSSDSLSRAFLQIRIECRRKFFAIFLPFSVLCVILLLEYMRNLFPSISPLFFFLIYFSTNFPLTILPLVFWYFQGVYNETSGMKWLKLGMMDGLWIPKGRGMNGVMS